jgi:hypothetical protein
MTHAAVVLPSAAGARYFGPATVVETHVNGDPNLVRVHLRERGGAVYARTTLEMTQSIQKNDEVLAAGENLRDLFVIGVLHAASPRGQGPYKMQIDGKAHAAVRDRKLEVYGEQGELIFEYQPSKGTARVHTASGNLEVTVPQGNLFLSCGKLLRMQADEVRIDGKDSVNLEVCKTGGRPGSSVTLGSHQLNVNAADLQATAQRSRWHVQETRYIGKTMLACIDQVQLVSERVETMAGTVIERAKDVFRTITNCYQIRAKRKRSLIETTLHTKARNIIFKSDQDVKVKADQIHLG